MPGLFDPDNNQQPSGGGILQGIAGVLSPEIYRQNALEQAYRQNGFDPVTARAMAIDPQAASGIMGQRIMQQNYHDLVSSGVSPGLAGMMATHPEMITKLGEIQKLGPGEAPYNALSGMLGAAPNSSQQQPPSSQPSGGSIPGMGPTNMAGAIEPDALRTLVERRLTGDIEAGSEVKAGGISGMNPLNNAAFQKLLTQTMAERGISGTDLAKRDAKFPAYKKAQQDLGDMQARMGTAQTEFGQIWPQFMQAVGAWQSRYPQGMTQFPSGNAFLQFIDKNAGDPSVAPLKQYTTTLRNIYGRAITTNPRGPTDSDKAHFDEGVNTHWNMGQMEQLGTALSNEMSAAQQSIPIQRNITDVEYGMGKKLDPATQQQARDAIARGADKNRVIHRLKENGIDPTGL